MNTLGEVSVEVKFSKIDNIFKGTAVVLQNHIRGKFSLKQQFESRADMTYFGRIWFFLVCYVFWSLYL